MAGFDPKALKTNEWGVVGGAVVAFIGLFFQAWGVTVKGTTILGQSVGGYSGGVSGWHFTGLWIPVLLVLASAGLVVLKALKPDVVPAQIAPFVLLIPFFIGVFAVIIELLDWLDFPSVGSDGGASFGTYLIVIATIVSTVFGYLLFTSTGMKLQHLKHLIPKSTGTTPPADPPADPAV
jgi:hypothetical protein